MKHLSLIVLSFMVSGCLSLAPKYQRPDLPVATTFDTTVALQNHQSVLELPWKDFVHEASLAKVIDLALQHNRNLRKALANIEVARATYRIARSGEFPSIEANLAGSKARTNADTITQSSSATLGISSYELDLFGKVKQMSEQELETYLSVQEAAKTVQLTLISETISAWLTLIADEALLELSSQTLKSTQETYEIIQKRVALGIDTDITLLNAKTLYEEAKISTLTYQTHVEQDKAALELLVGNALSEDNFPKNLDASSQHWLHDVPVGLSSEILLQRPDVLEAEHTLKAANANIGVARAAYFPSITLTAKGGLGSSTLSGLFSGATSSIWSFSPSLNLPIFDAGSKDATLEYAKAKNDAAIAAYDLTIQTAFKEVKSALARRKTILEQLETQSALVDSNLKSHHIYLSRYEKGVDSYLNVLITQRSLYAAQQTLITTMLQELTNRVTLYQALGGGLKN